MDDASIDAVVSELNGLLTGRGPGKIFQLGSLSYAIDFGLRSRGYLFVSAEPALPRLYLIKRRVRDLEEHAAPLGQFGLTLRKELAGAELISIERDESERIVRLDFKMRDELGYEHRRTLITQLTGRAANLFLLNAEHAIISQARPGRGPGQLAGDKYQPPPAQPRAAREASRPIASKGGSISEALDAHYSIMAAEQAYKSRAAAARADLRKRITREKKLLAQLENDLAGHADAERNKRIGDLLLANVGSAKRTDDRVRLIDYFADGMPEVEIEIDEKTSLPEEASRLFAQYSRSKRARQQIAVRLETVKSQLAKLEAQRDELERSIAANENLSAPSASAAGPHSGRESRRKPEKKISGVRRYLSSDGFEILVGRAARDNDNLTFKVARPNDLWLHAADYPGSHVVIRNPTRKDTPHRTIIEAAQLAAYFSQASKDPKVDVHYTARKFLSKPKGAAPGLVRMSRFKNITVQPTVNIHRVLD